MGDSDDAGDIVLTLLWHAMLLTPQLQLLPLLLPLMLLMLFLLLRHPQPPMTQFPLLPLPPFASSDVTVAAAHAVAPSLVLWFRPPFASSDAAAAAAAGAALLYPLVCDDARDVHTNLVPYHAIHQASFQPGAYEHLNLVLFYKPRSMRWTVTLLTLIDN